VKVAALSLPANAPDRNPGERAWKHPQAPPQTTWPSPAATASSGIVRSSMRQLQNYPKKIRSFYQKPSLKYAA
jgi:hypothetical protein